MATDKSFATYICDQLSPLGSVQCRPLFGEYGGTVNGLSMFVIAGNKLFWKVKELDSEKIQELFGNHNQPYHGAKNYAEVPSHIVEEEYELMKLVREVIKLTQ